MPHCLRASLMLVAACLFVVIAGGCGGGGSTGSPHPTGKVAIAAQTVTLTDDAGNPTSRTLSIPAVSAAPRQEISLPVTVSDLTGVAGAMVGLDLDKTVLACADVTPGAWVSPQAQVVKSAKTAAIAVASTSPCAACSAPAVVATFRLRVFPAATPQDVSLKLTVVLCDAKGNTLGRAPGQSSSAAKPQGVSILIGDLTGTGKAEIGSATKVLRVVVGLDAQPSAAQLWQWDCNKSGAVDVGDATKILRCVVGLDPWPIGARSVEYEIIDLGTLPGGLISYAQAINASGQVVGNAETAASCTDAFLYSDGKMTDLGRLGGYYAYATGINASGQVVGYTNTASSGGDSEAFLCSNGVMTDLGSPMGWYDSRANGVNDSGQVVGYGTDPYPFAFLYSGGKMTNLGVLPGDYASVATGINTSGQVAGYSYLIRNPGSNAYFEDHAFLYSGGKMTGLGTLPGGSYSRANAINASGQVVGESGPVAGWCHAFLYSGGKMVDLGTLPGMSFASGTGINASGQVVGNSGALGIPFLYSGGSMKDLNSLVSGTGWRLDYAAAINDTGQIVGYGVTSDQVWTHAYLLSPAAAK